MKLNLKKITLKDDTLLDIENNGIEADVDKFISSYHEIASNITDLTNNKIASMDGEVLFDKLSKVFDITIDPKDYYSALSLLFNKHYSGVINVLTTMKDKDNKTVTLKLLISSKARVQDRFRLSVKELRKLTNNYDVIVLSEGSVLEKDKFKAEYYENFKYVDVDTTSNDIDPNNPLSAYLYEVLKKSILPKDILALLKQAFRELKYQRISIFKLDESEDVLLKTIAAKYKKAFDVYSNSDDAKKIIKKENRKY